MDPIIGQPLERVESVKARGLVRIDVRPCTDAVSPPDTKFEISNRYISQLPIYRRVKLFAGGELFDTIRVHFPNGHHQVRVSVDAFYR